MMTPILFISLIQKAEHGWKKLASSTFYVHISLDSSPTMLPLANIGKGFSLINQLHAHAGTLLLKQEPTFYMTVNGIKDHGTQSKSPSKMFSHFLNHGMFCFQEGITWV